MKQKITALLQQLNYGLVEREAHLKLTLLTVLTGENIVLVGPPGTGKSMIARRVAECLEQPDNNPVHFEYLLTKFSTPEEIFGPLSISELKADRFRRNTTGYLPSVKVAFLDEIFKASSSILNALLTILNERIYHNGATAEKVPLQALIAASNELPSGQEELAALYDRFLIRSFVDYVSPENLSRLFEQSSASPTLIRLDSEDLAEITQRAEGVTLPAEIKDAIQRIWQQHKEAFKEDRRESLSDRRLKKLINLLRVSAVTNDRHEVDLSDVLLLKDCLWNHPDNAELVRNLILSTLKNYSRPVPYISEKSAGEVIYEVAEDGQTLILSNATQTFLPSHAVGTLPAVAGKKPCNIVKGFRGRGTQDDPLLIETVVELADLSRPEVGQQGYYFRQIADIDFSSFTTWPKIFFHGYYDGNGKTIKSKERYLFEELTDSNIKNINLEKTKLAKTINCCEIFFCTSDSVLVNNSHKSKIVKCKTIRQLTDHADGCKIIMCQTDFTIIKKTASNCQIENCLITGKYWGEAGFDLMGGIAQKITNNSVVRFCFFSKKGNGKICHSSGISPNCESSSIRYCAIGNSKVRIVPRIANVFGMSVLKQNISIDSNPGNSDPNGQDGESISAALFKQRYFEITLGWDFENIWYWDVDADEPRLRSIGAGNTHQQDNSPTSKAPTTDLLTQQLQANLWL